MKEITNNYKNKNEQENETKANGATDKSKKLENNNNNNGPLRNRQFQTWSFGTINIRSGKEKSEGAKIYMVAKEAAAAGLTFCCLQEVKYLNFGKKLVRLDTGESFEFHWCGKRKRREAGVGFLIRVDPKISIKDPDIRGPRIMAIDLNVYGFNIRVVNAYAPTNSDGSENEKNTFYKQLRKACKKEEKHQKLIVAGDFNANTSIAFKQCFYNGRMVIQDEYCNDNGFRLKSFCRDKNLCIASSYFDHVKEDRYTWYSPDKKTKKVNDYVLTEKFVQEYVIDCVARPEIDFDSDHCLLQTSLCTPTTRRARWKFKQVKTDKLSI